MKTYRYRLGQEVNREDYKLLPLAAVGIGKGLLEVYVKPLVEERRPSTLAWAGLVAGVVCYDLLAPEGETLSEGFDTFIENHPALAWGATVLTAAHLTNIIPQKYDPIHRLVELL